MAENCIMLWYQFKNSLHIHIPELGIEPLEYALLSNQNLNSIVTNIRQNTPNTNEAHIGGTLRSRSIRVQGWRVILSLCQVDLIGRSLKHYACITPKNSLFSGPQSLMPSKEHLNSTYRQLVTKI